VCSSDLGSEGQVFGTSLAAKEDVQLKIILAAKLAAAAYECEVNGDITNAYYRWRKLYNWQFPAY